MMGTFKMVKIWIKIKEHSKRNWKYCLNENNKTNGFKNASKRDFRKIKRVIGKRSGLSRKYLKNCKEDAEY